MTEATAQTRISVSLEDINALPYEAQGSALNFLVGWVDAAITGTGSLDAERYHRGIAKAISHAERAS